MADSDASVVVVTRRTRSPVRRWRFSLGPCHVPTEGKSDTNSMLLMSLEEGKSRRDLEQEGWVGVGVGRKEYPHLSLKTTSPTCHAPQELQRMLCETGMLMGNLLSLESKMYPASSVAPRYYPDLKKPLEILSFICLSVLPSVHQIFISGFSNPNSI